MKKLIFLLLFLGLAAGMINAANVLGKNDVIGEWKFEVSTAPYGYQKGVITISENDNVLGGVVKFDTGNEVRLSSVIIEGDALKLGLYVENEYVVATIKIVERKMEGTVDSSQGKMLMKAEKKS